MGLLKQNKRAVMVMLAVIFLGLLASLVLVQKQTQTQSSATGSGKVTLSLKVLEDNGSEKKIGLYVDKVEGLAAVNVLTASVRFDPNQIDSSQTGENYFMENSRLFIGDSANSGSPFSSWKATKFKMEPDKVMLQIFTTEKGADITSNSGNNLLIGVFAFKFTSLEDGVEMDFNTNETSAEGSGGGKYQIQTNPLKLDPENVVKLYFGRDSANIQTDEGENSIKVPLMLSSGDKKIAAAHIELDIQTELQAPREYTVSAIPNNSQFSKVYARVDEIGRASCRERV